MKHLALTLLCFLVHIRSADAEFLGEGEAVHIVRSKEGISSSPSEEMLGGRALLSKVSFVVSKSLPKSYIVYGTIVSDNTGGPLERVLVRVGEKGAVPVVCGMTNVDGEFKFRLWVNEDRRNPEPQLREPFVGYLYVGGRVGDLDRNTPKMGATLRRLQIASLKQFSDSASETSGQDAAPQIRPR